MRITSTVLFLGVAAAWAQQPPGTPDWQQAAGGAMSFEVASVKPTKAPSPPNLTLALALAVEGARMPAGGRLSIAMPLEVFIKFAYKLPESPEQERILMHLPQSVSGLYQIDAKAAAGNPTKDQMRLMVQSLLADRFKLKVHLETRDAAVLLVRLARSGEMGPKLRRHDEGAPCPDADPRLLPFPEPKKGEVFPPVCGAVLMRQTNAVRLIGGRDLTMASLAEGIYTNGKTAGEVEKPVLDGTGLQGRFDFTVEFTPGENDQLRRGPLFTFGGRPPEARPPDSQGPTFLEAVRKQLGLKLTPEKGAIEVLVVDHVEPPTEN